MPKQPNWPGDLKAHTRRVKRVAKAFGAYNYTPLWATRLAEIFVNLSEHGSEERKLGMLGLIRRILEGQNK